MYLARQLKIHEAKTDKTEGRSRQFNNSSWNLQYSVFNNGRVSRQKINEEIENSVNQLEQTNR
jgi:hypothetical protein